MRVQVGHSGWHCQPIVLSFPVAGVFSTNLPGFFSEVLLYMNSYCRVVPLIISVADLGYPSQPTQMGTEQHWQNNSIFSCLPSDKAGG